MKAPWAEKTGMSKAVAILSTLALVSAGLCGVNFAAFMGLERHPLVTSLLMLTAYLELVGMVVGAGGLVAVLLFSTVRGVVRMIRGKGEDR